MVMYFACMGDFNIKPVIKLEMFPFQPLNQIVVNRKITDNILLNLPSSDTAARKVKNLLTKKTCYTGWVEPRAYRQWTGLTQMCQIICTFKFHHNSMKHKFISNTCHKKKNKTSSFTRRKCTFWLWAKNSPFKKWLKHLFLVIRFNTQYVPLLRIIPPVLQWDGRACDNVFVHGWREATTVNTSKWH